MTPGRSGGRSTPGKDEGIKGVPQPSSPPFTKQSVTPRSTGFLPVTKVKTIILPNGETGHHYTVGECNVIQTDKRHFSISHTQRDPTWEEIASTRYALLPKAKDCVMVLPPEWDYANLHEHCFHVHLLRALVPGERLHNSEAW
jgi:hypothetical protein